MVECKSSTHQAHRCKKKKADRQKQFTLHSFHSRRIHIGPPPYCRKQGVTLRTRSMSETAMLQQLTRTGATIDDVWHNSRLATVSHDECGTSRKVVRIT